MEGIAAQVTTAQEWAGHGLVGWMVSNCIVYPSFSVYFIVIIVIYIFLCCSVKLFGCLLLLEVFVVVGFVFSKPQVFHFVS